MRVNRFALANVLQCVIGVERAVLSCHSMAWQMVKLSL